MLELYILNINEIVSEQQCLEWLHKVSKKQRNRIEEFRFIKDVKRSLYGEILVRHLICQKLHLKSGNIIIERNLYGKPYLKGCPTFKFNLSHSGDWVVCLISHCEVGVDIEKIASANLRIAERFFKRIEYEALLEEPKNEWQKKFCHIWTAKESYIKYIGKGLSVPLNSFEVKEIKSAEYEVDIDKCCIIKTIDIFPDYSISICVSSEVIHNLVIQSMRLKDIKV